MTVKFKVYRVVPLALSSCVLPVVSFALNADPVGSGPGPGIRYATDAYPGFDDDESFLNPKRKEPRWFSWFFGPKCDSPQSQMAHCRALESEAEWTKAVREYDALVRQWPNSKEAVFAQRSLADILSGKLGEMQKAYEEYRYLADFYSLDCDYESVVDEMYKIAGVMRIEGKTIVFFRFRNTVDVRRAFEGCVLRAPGAKWAAQAMLQIGELREEDARYSEAVKVYENLRNIHYGSPEAKQALVKEASARMQIIRQYGYNRERCQDTVSFLKLALESCEGSDAELVSSWLAEAMAQLENEAFAAAKFYDSRMRTMRSAINAYEKFLAEYPDGEHAPEVRFRLEELKGMKGEGR